MLSTWLGTSTPMPCKWNWSMVTPPNKYAPRSTRPGRQVAKVVSAKAIQPFIVWDALKMVFAALTVSGLWTLFKKRV